MTKCVFCTKKSFINKLSVLYYNTYRFEEGVEMCCKAKSELSRTRKDSRKYQFLSKVGDTLYRKIKESVVKRQLISLVIVSEFDSHLELIAFTIFTEYLP